MSDVFETITGFTRFLNLHVADFTNLSLILQHLWPPSMQIVHTKTFDMANSLTYTLIVVFDSDIVSQLAALLTL